MAPRSRPSWHQFFMQIVDNIAQRSTCLRRQVGAVLVKDKHIIATGFNGAPRGLSHCSICMREEANIRSGTRLEYCRAVHAELNAIIQAAYHGTSTKGATLYCTNYPCSLCARAIINAGIEKVYYQEEYNDPLAKELFQEAEIKCERKNGQTQES